MNKRTILNASLVSAMALMVVAGWLAFRALTASREDEQWVAHTYLVMLDLNQLVSTVQDAETGQRRFIITGNKSYLQPYEDGVKDVHQQLASLRNLTKDNPRQQAHLDNIEATVQAKLAELKETLQLRQSSGFESARMVVATDRGKVLMDEFRGRVAVALAEERQLLKERTLATTDSARKTLQFLSVAGLLGCAFLLTGLVALRIHGDARRAMARSKEELEDVVQERTAELREAMDELEHMSYSMIHDMRAPLRAMQSFAMLLEDECADGLKPTGLDYARRIGESAKRLDRLITGALNYNQVVRQYSEPTAVELGKLLRGMLETYPNLQRETADIGIEFKELVVLGDESLLTQCFGNLLGNAAKFVAPTVKPRIRVWAEEKHRGAEKPRNGDGDRVRIWVEDNGIGIPKEAHEKIFGMFQRLHRENEYPGTGIGLAIVRKAVERMGGEVALESEPGKGSRFWVELPRANRAENMIAPEVAP